MAVFTRGEGLHLLVAHRLELHIGEGLDLTDFIAAVDGGTQGRNDIRGKCCKCGCADGCDLLIAHSAHLLGGERGCLGVGESGNL